MDTYKDFNILSRQFFDLLIDLVPHEEKFKSSKNALNSIIYINNGKPLKVFMDTMCDCGFHILSKDEIFFKNTKEEYILVLNKHWDSFPDKSKEDVWKHLQGLYIIGMKVQKKHDELNSLIKHVNKNKKF